MSATLYCCRFDLLTAFGTFDLLLELVVKTDPKSFSLLVKHQLIGYYEFMLYLYCTLAYSSECLFLGIGSKENIDEVLYA